ncbi:MutS-related protein [Fulvivirga ligni]|uniref:MutS-related protein n=1 Tax=Fulvivirga ligni TaxID=2904246 RepID=UPI001F267478|nr:hypothetical protein [Fulvivirga ligni]UII24370.1 hypothetical protein LVD16_21240 [Fulvivirga ligni]
MCFAKSFTLQRTRVLSAIRISDDLMSEKSYYFEEVNTIKAMLEQSKTEAPCLFLLDEMFKGTNTIERISAGKSVLSYLNQGNNMVIISTHDIELAHLLADSYSLYHFAENVEGDEILFDYKIKEGHLKTTNAIRILEINGYPISVVDEAKAISETLRK